MDATALVRRLRAGELSAREAVDEHVRRIEAVDPALNAVVVPLFDEAWEAAAAADRRRVRGPLHGLPVTVKECFDVAGTPTTAGVTQLADRPVPRDSAIVAALRAAGAIILGKTNLSQLGWFGEADNPLFGRTSNPWDLDRSPAGSSGGEAAIIAAGGSPLGVGTDSGGSARVPAHCCGIHAFKPTSGRLSAAGTFDDRLFGWAEARAFNQPGPLARSVRDLRLFLDAVGGRREQPTRVGSLTVGVQLDGLVPSSPAVRRVVGEAGGILGQLGARVDAFETPALGESARLCAAVFCADGGAGMRRALGDSPRDARIETALAEIGPALSAAEHRELAEGCDRYRASWSAALHARGLDVLVCPALAWPAFRHGEGPATRPGRALASLPNLVGAPAGVVAASRVRAGEAADGAGLPVGVQVVGRPGRDSLVLDVMECLERAFRQRPGYPATAPGPRRAGQAS